MKKKGISLILLVITIIIIIIIASAVILNLNNNNPVDKARLANVQSTRDSLKSGINLYIGKIMVKENGNHNASTMILGKNTQVIDYSIIHDYSIYETIRGNLNIWQLDYTAINEKVNLKLDIYDNNSRWYIDEWGNPFLVYNSLTNVSPYLKTEDGTAILSSVQDFVVVLDNVEFAENSTLGKANTYKSSITNAVKRYLGANASSLNEIADSSSVKITVNGVDTNLYKLNISNLNTKVGTNLTDTYDSADWYIDENGNTYLIYDTESNIPEEIKGGVSTNSYVTVNGGTITGYVATSNSSSGESGNGNNNQGSSEQGNIQKEDGNITLSSTSGALTYGNSLDITVTNPNGVEISAVSSNETILPNENILITNNNKAEVTISLTALSNAGDATITITGASNSSYNEVSEEYILSVWGGTGAMPIGVAKASINSTNIRSYLGQQVDYTPAGGGTWRIFYLDITGKYDEPGTLIIKRDLDNNLRSDFSGNKYIAPTSNTKEYSTFLADFSNFNQLWAEKDGNINDYNEIKAASLCYRDRWTLYCDSNVAKYAIGTPSVELFMDSYNQWKNNPTALVYDFGNGAKGYSVGTNGSYPNPNKTNNNSVDTGPNEIYRKSSNINGCWLSSGSRESASYLFSVTTGYNYINYGGSGSSYYCLSPIAILKK